MNPDVPRIRLAQESDRPENPAVPGDVEPTSAAGCSERVGARSVGREIDRGNRVAVLSRRKTVAISRGRERVSAHRAERATRGRAGYRTVSYREFALKATTSGPTTDVSERSERTEGGVLLIDLLPSVDASRSASGAPDAARTWF